MERKKRGKKRREERYSEKANIGKSSSYLEEIKQFVCPLANPTNVYSKRILY